MIEHDDSILSALCLPWTLQTTLLMPNIRWQWLNSPVPGVLLSRHLDKERSYPKVEFSKGSQVAIYLWTTIHRTTTIFAIDICRSNVCFKKSVTHLLLYTILNVWQFLWNRLYLLSFKSIFSKLKSKQRRMLEIKLRRRLKSKQRMMLKSKLRRKLKSITYICQSIMLCIIRLDLLRAFSHKSTC